MCCEGLDARMYARNAETAETEELEGVIRRWQKATERGWKGGETYTDHSAPCLPTRKSSLTDSNARPSLFTFSSSMNRRFFPSFFLSERDLFFAFQNIYPLFPGFLIRILRLEADRGIISSSIY